MNRHRTIPAQRLPTRMAIACLVLLMMSGCAVKQALHDDPRDPWEGYNRQVFAFNEGLDAVVLKPVASGYKKILPDFVERGISNVFSNVGELPTALNNFLQGDFVGSGSDLLRFLINTTLGVFGLFDPATSMGLIKQEEDFGQTLAVWGVGPGPYFVVPLLGPSTTRDLPGKIVDMMISPVNWVEGSDARFALQMTELISTRASFLNQEEILRDLAPDFYQQLRAFYLNRREHLIRDAASGGGEALYKELLEDELEEE